MKELKKHMGKNNNNAMVMKRSRSRPRQEVWQKKCKLFDEKLEVAAEDEQHGDDIEETWSKKRWAALEDIDHSWS